MVWQPEIDELEHRRHLAEQMGGKERIARQHAQGKLTVRERIAEFADPWSFQEIGTLAGSATYDDDNKLKSFTPESSVIGLCTLNGRKVLFNAGDFTARSERHGTPGGKYAYAVQLAQDWRLPYIRLLDSYGGSVRTFDEIGRTYIPGGPNAQHTSKEVGLLCVVPVVSAVMGSVAGAPAMQACYAHFNVMVKGTSLVFVAGPPAVKAALGYDITKEELGGEKTQAYKSGTIDNVANSEEEAFAIIKRFLSYMPDNVWEMPPRIEPTDDPNRREEELLSIVPRERSKTYNPYTILKHILDRDSFFEIAPFYGQSRRTGLARVNGYAVGVMINDSRYAGGSMDIAAGQKVIRFLQMCDTFHLPVVYFADEPGFMIGIESETRGIIRAGAAVVCTVNRARMPYIVFILRQIYGVAGGHHFRASGMFKRYAWPSAHWGSMHIEGGAMAAYRREIDTAPDPEAKREEIEQRLKALASPFRTAEAFNIEDIIDPRDTRPLLCDYIETAQGVLRSQLGPSPVLFRP